MIKSMFSGVAGLRTHQTKMDVIGNNIANVNTFGFKAGRVTFKDSFYQTLNGSSAGNANFGGGNASQIGYGSSVNSIDVIHTGGSPAQTDDPSDVLINGNGYFMVGPRFEDKLDPSKSQDVTRLQLTRVGIFRFDGNGNLADPNKNLVYGFAGESAGTEIKDLVATGGADKIFTTPKGDRILVEDTSATVASVKIYDAATKAWVALDPAKGKGLEIFTTIPDPAGGAGDTLPVLKVSLIDESELVPLSIPVDPVTGEAIKLKNISFGKDGTITGTADGNKVVTVGRLAIANVPNPNALEMMQGSYYQARENTGAVTAYSPGNGTTGSIQSGALEMANVDLSKEFSEMITTQRGFQANTRIITVSDEMLQELVNLKR